MAALSKFMTSDMRAPDTPGSIDSMVMTRKSRMPIPQRLRYVNEPLLVRRFAMKISSAGTKRLRSIPPDVFFGTTAMSLKFSPGFEA